MSNDDGGFAIVFIFVLIYCLFILYINDNQKTIKIKGLNYEQKIN